MHLLFHNWFTVVDGREQFFLCFDLFSSLLMVVKNVIQPSSDSRAYVVGIFLNSFPVSGYFHFNG